jgi:hypothetical protein
MIHPWTLSIAFTLICSSSAFAKVISVAPTAPVNGDTIAETYVELHFVVVATSATPREVIVSVDGFWKTPQGGIATPNRFGGFDIAYQFTVGNVWNIKKQLGISLVANDYDGSEVTTNYTLLINRKPTLTLNQPTQTVVNGFAVNIDAQCVDDYTTDPLITVGFMNGSKKESPLQSQKSKIQTEISLLDYGGTTQILYVECVDGAGESQLKTFTVVVPTLNASLSLVEQIPGEILDVTAESVLYLNASSIVLLDRNSQNEITIAQYGCTTDPLGRLFEGSVIYRGCDFSVYRWAAATTTALVEATNYQSPPDQLQLAGSFLLVNFENAPFLRIDLSTEVQAKGFTSQSEPSLGEDGTVCFHKDDDIQLLHCAGTSCSAQIVASAWDSISSGISTPNYYWKKPYGCLYSNGRWLYRERSGANMSSGGSYTRHIAMKTGAQGTNTVSFFKLLYDQCSFCAWPSPLCGPSCPKIERPNYDAAMNPDWTVYAYPYSGLKLRENTTGKAFQLTSSPSGNGSMPDLTIEALAEDGTVAYAYQGEFHLAGKTLTPTKVSTTAGRRIMRRDASWYLLDKGDLYLVDPTNPQPPPVPDAGLEDAGLEDAGIEDASVDGAGTVDMGNVDAGITDTVAIPVKDASVDGASVTDAGPETTPKEDLTNDIETDLGSEDGMAPSFDGPDVPIPASFDDGGCTIPRVPAGGPSIPLCLWMLLGLALRRKRRT